MTDNSGTVTVEATLGVLEDVIQKAAGDLLTARNLLARSRAGTAGANTPVSRTIIADAERVIDHLRHADQALTSVLSKLSDSVA
jgi:hypothetical protein